MNLKDVEFFFSSPGDRKMLEEEEFNKMLEEHKAWLKKGDGNGTRLDLSNKDMHYFNMNSADLRKANLKEAYLYESSFIFASLEKTDLTRADLRGANLRGADLTEACLNNADLYLANLFAATVNKADLRKADLHGANLRGARFVGADLREADLRNANLRGAYLEGANLTGADLRGAHLDDTDLTKTQLVNADLKDASLKNAILEGACGLPALACPEKGSFTGWKFADLRIHWSSAFEPVLIELVIPASAKRSSGTGRKCRCSKAKVKRIVSIFTGEELKEAVSNYDRRFKYVVGETVEVKNFDEDRWNECAPGIHFFMTQVEAFRYVFEAQPGEDLYNKFKLNGKINDTEKSPIII